MGIKAGIHSVFSDDRGRKSYRTRFSPTDWNAICEKLSLPNPLRLLLLPPCPAEGVFKKYGTINFCVNNEASIAPRGREKLPECSTP
jgi:hypothetical protein